jgi:glycosyltransferase involved in cell wall biosynthesis
VTRTITISIDQLFRPQPGGIATYVRGLAQGLASLDDSSLDVVGLAPRGPVLAGATDLPLRIVRSALPLAALTRLWPLRPLGVPRESDVVHATSMAGPFAGGSRHAVHSIAMHDLLWRDEPLSTTPSGIHFHEQRLKLITTNEQLRILVTSPGLRERLVGLGIDAVRIVNVRFGVDDDDTVAASYDDVRGLLLRHGVVGPFTLYAGTLEPRKNIERLVAAHALARSESPDVGDLVIVGPSGWGNVATGDATLLGLVPQATLKGLYRDAAIFAYVPRAEGFGLPPVEALHAGTRVVASSTTPSVTTNDCVVRVDALDVDAIAHGLVTAVALDDDEKSATKRRESVADLTWRNAALDHLSGWQ